MLWRDSHRMAEAGMGFKAIDMVNWNICISSLSSNYHLIEVATLSDTRHGHMVLLTKFTD